MKIPVFSDLHINAFSGGTITELESGMTNGIVQVGASGKYLTQRPSIDIFADASATTADAAGRAIYYWDGNTALYFVNKGTIYKTDYATVIGAVTAGTKKGHFFVVGTSLVFLDPQNDQGWTITAGGTLTQITDVDFPPKQTPAVGLAFGGAVLDGRLYVLGDNGYIYGSDLANAAAWNALNFLDAEREPDGGIYLAKHHDNLVNLGARSIEFFYDAENATGSALARRQDIYYSIGCASGEAVLEIGDVIIFAGVGATGAIGIYTINNFALSKVSTETIDSFLTSSVVRDGYSITASGLSGAGHTYYLLTVYTLVSGVVSPLTTLCYDAASGLWSQWSTVAAGLTKFPLMSWSVRTGSVSRFGEGIFSNGDLLSVTDLMIPQDTAGGLSWVQPGWVQSGWVMSSAATPTPITLKSRTGQFDGDTQVRKTMAGINVVGERTSASQTLTLRWSNESSRNFNAGVAVDTSKYERVNRLGQYRRRNFEIEYSGSEQIRTYALEDGIK